jgi:prolipoprotein diacylglyceryltransferase
MYAVSFGKYATVVPTQLFEALFLFALCGLCFYLVWVKNFKHNLSVYLIAYGIFRFCLEYVRADDRGELIPGLTPSQFWSVLMVVAGIALIFVLNIFFKKREAEIEGMLEAQAAEKSESKEERMERIANEAREAHAWDRVQEQNQENQNTEEKDIEENTEA